MDAWVLGMVGVEWGQRVNWWEMGGWLGGWLGGGLGVGKMGAGFLLEARGISITVCP